MEDYCPKNWFFTNLLIFCLSGILECILTFAKLDLSNVFGIKVKGDSVRNVKACRHFYLTFKAYKFFIELKKRI